MDFNWQDWAAWVLVVGAAAYLGRKFWRVLAGKKAGGCGTCASCPAEDQTNAKPLVQIDSLVKAARRQP